MTAPARQQTPTWELWKAMSDPAELLNALTADFAGATESAEAHRRSAASRNAVEQYRHHEYNMPGRYVQDMVRAGHRFDTSTERKDVHALERLDRHSLLRFALADVGTADTPQAGLGYHVHAEQFYIPTTGWLAALSTLVPDPVTLSRVPPLADFGAGAQVVTVEKVELVTTVPDIPALPPIDTTVATGVNVSAQALWRDPIYRDQISLALLSGVDRKLEATIAQALGGTAVAGNDPFPAMTAAAAAAGDRLGDVVILAGEAAAARIVERLADCGLAANLYVNNLVPTDVAYVAAPRGVTVLATAAHFAEQVTPATMVTDLVAFRMTGSFLRAPGALQVLTTSGTP